MAEQRREINRGRRRVHARGEREFQVVNRLRGFGEVRDRLARRTRTALVTATFSAILAAPAAAQQPEPLHATLVREIGVDEASLVFDHIASVTVTPRGEVVVVETRLGLVRVVHPATLQEKAVGRGRRGSGPGEFRGPRLAGQIGDGIWVWDSTLRRITMFGPAGEVVRTIALPDLVLAAPLAAGGFVGLGAIRSLEERGEILEVGRLWIYGEDGAVVRDSVDLHVGLRAEERITLDSGTFRTVLPQPWSDRRLWAPSPAGDGFVVVDRLTTGPAVMQVHRYDSHGRKDWTVTLPYEPVEITRAHVRAMADLLGSGVRGLVERRGIPVDVSDFTPAAVARQLRVPERFPPVTAVTVARSGYIFLRGPAPAGAREAEFRILTPDGRWSHTVTLPAEFTLHDAAGSALWGTHNRPGGENIIVAEYRLR